MTVPWPLANQVYRRDGWRCQVPDCLHPDGRAIRRKLRGTDDPWSPSIDHIVDVALGGSDDLRNLRAAHKLCNAERAARRLLGRGSRAILPQGTAADGSGPEGTAREGG